MIDHILVTSMPLAVGGYKSGCEVALVEPGILHILFNRPKLMNRMSQPLKRDLIEVLAQAQMDRRVRVVVFEGEEHFAAGDDLTAGPSGTSTAGQTLMPPIHPGHERPISTYNGLRLLSQPLNTAVRQLDKITVAAMEGFAIQTGFSLALACDFRVASRSAKMGSATLRFGLLPDEGGQYLLVQHLGVAKAMDFLMRKRIVSSKVAHELGLVHEVCEPQQLRAHAMALAKEMADGPQVAMRLLKRSIYTAAESNWHQALEDIASKTAISDHHPDAEEGVKAWREKREARFNVWLEPKAKL